MKNTKDRKDKLLMWRKLTIYTFFIIFVCCASAVLAVSINSYSGELVMDINQSSVEPSVRLSEHEFLFDSSRHTVHNPVTFASEIAPSTFDEYNYLSMQSARMAIVIGEVAGPSINRIVRPTVFGGPGGDHHVITPILIHHIIHSGNEFMDISIGDIINVKEGYYYVTLEMEDRSWGLMHGDIITIRGARPMETGNRYLMYIAINPYSNEIFHYNGEIIPSATHRKSIYMLSPSSSGRSLVDEPDCPYFHQWWQDAMQMYGHLATELPWPTHPESIINQISFNLGDAPASRAAPAVITPLDANAGFALHNFILTRHTNFPADGPARPGYDFAGWYLDPDFTTPLIDTMRMPAYDITLYARWQNDEPTPPTTTHHSP